MKYVTLMGLTVLALLHLSLNAHSQSDSPTIWSGKIKFITEQYGHSGTVVTATGLVKYIWDIEVNWKETDRIDIRNKKGALTGQFVKLEEDSAPGQGWLKKRLEWNLSKKTDVVCTLEKIDKTWRPMGGSQSMTHLLKAHAKLDQSKDLQGKFRFRLSEVSKEKGYAMNVGDETDFDLKFSDNQEGYEPAQEMSDGWQVDANASKDYASIWITPLDYGAWAKLRAEVNVDGEWYDCQTEDGKSYVTVPHDENENWIPDFWEDLYNIKDQSADSDKDAEPKGREDGDGFSNYEEYRGFRINSTWQTTDPNKKDLFIHAEGGLDKYVGGFENATDLTIHAALREDEYNGNDSRTVNFNRGHSTQGPQKGLYLKVNALDEDIFGEVTNIGSPNVVQAVMIDLSKMSFESTIEETVAHELGHGVNIRHHGDDRREGICAPDSNDAVWGGLSSGDQPCLMRYDASFFTHYIGWNGQCYDYPNTDHITLYLCENKTGTGINAGNKRLDDNIATPVAGPAIEFGNCKNNVTLKGEHHNGY